MHSLYPMLMTTPSQKSAHSLVHYHPGSTVFFPAKYGQNEAHIFGAWFHTRTSSHDFKRINTRKNIRYILVMLHWVWIVKSRQHSIRASLQCLSSCACACVFSCGDEIGDASCAPVVQVTCARGPSCWNACFRGVHC